MGSENGALVPTSILVGLQDFVQSILLYCSPQGFTVFLPNHNILCSLSSLNIGFVILFTVI